MDIVLSADVGALIIRAQKGATHVEIEAPLIVSRWTPLQLDVLIRALGQARATIHLPGVKPR